MPNPWDSGIMTAIRKFRCAYCNQKRPKGTIFRFVDGRKSCESCNRLYDYKPNDKEFLTKCPLCGLNSDVRQWKGRTE
jgi:hypothetical protein